ncbi:MAG: alpha/beta hydrolase [Lachnospiraceae bacterium]|nr:alpha/beta hydrolase [Lachnospiraceae bacterium]
MEEKTVRKTEIRVSGISTYYLEAGSGQLVVLLHGWGSNADLYRRVIDALSLQYHVAAPVFPGCSGESGPSDEPSEPWSVDDYVGFVKEFTQELLKKDGLLPGDRSDPADLPGVIFLGHSHGGRVLIKLAGRDADTLPFRIEKLILVDSAGIVPEKTEAQKAAIRRYKAGKKFLESPVMKTLFPEALEKFKKSHGSADYRSASPVMRDTMVRVVNEDEREWMPEIKAETLLIWGTADADTPIASGEIMESMIPGSGLARIEGAGHFSFIDNEYLFIRILKSFLNMPL